MAEQAKPQSEDTKESKLAELQKQIDKLIEEREKLKGGS
jgi:hypothetical protein